MIDKKWAFGLSLVCAAALLPVSRASQDAAIPTVYLPPGPVIPGQTLVVEFQSNQRKNPVLLIEGEEIPFFKSAAKKWRALVRVPLDHAAGEWVMSARGKVRRWGKDITIPIAVTVAETAYEKETIIFPAEKTALLNDPSEDEESRLFREKMAETLNDPQQRWSGVFIRPVPGELLSPYGITREKIGQNRLDFHRGVDLKAPLGEPILAPAGAEVLLAQNLKFHGKTVLLNHGQGVSSIYIHMDEIQVEEGETLTAGQTLGTAGSTGLATAPHLHWGVYVRGKAVDPLQWLEVAF